MTSRKFWLIALLRQGRWHWRSDALGCQAGPRTVVSEALGRQVDIGTAVSRALERQVGPGTAVSETLGHQVGPGTTVLATFEHEVASGPAAAGLGRFWGTCREGSWTVLGPKQVFGTFGVHGALKGFLAGNIWIDNTIIIY